MGPAPGAARSRRPRTLVQLTSRSSGGRCRLGRRGIHPGRTARPCELTGRTTTHRPEGRRLQVPRGCRTPGPRGGAGRLAAPEKVAPLLELRPWEKCGDCPYLAVCVGGCLAASTSDRAAATKWPAEGHVRVPVSARASSSVTSRSSRSEPQQHRIIGEPMKINRSRGSPSHPGGLRHGRVQPTRRLRIFRFRG